MDIQAEFHTLPLFWVIALLAVGFIAGMMTKTDVKVTRTCCCGEPEDDAEQEPDVWGVWIPGQEPNTGSWLRNAEGNVLTFDHQRRAAAAGWSWMNSPVGPADFHQSVESPRVEAVRIGKHGGPIW